MAKVPAQKLLNQNKILMNDNELKGILEENESNNGDFGYAQNFAQKSGINHE